MKNLLILFSLLLSIFQAGAQQLVVMESMHIHSRILDKEVHFSVCLPDDYYESKTTTYPVNYLLHGLGDDETGWLEYGNVKGFANRAIAAGDAVPMIFIMPEAFRTYYVNDYTGSFRYEDMFVNELVPAIDSIFRTKKDKTQRALTGYSMGGFGAMMLHLKHPDVFGACVPLSMSVRTDEQYKTEDASGWDDQWGRLFGVPGLKGEGRITDYYKRNSPFHFLQALTPELKKQLHIYMLNGDDEETLCRSNEELHLTMNALSIPHEYRVVNGGHSFKVWREAMPNALRFISDCFEGKPYRGDFDGKLYRGDKSSADVNGKVYGNGFSLTNITAGSINAFVPAEYTISNRKYPVLLISSDLNTIEQEKVAEIIYSYPLVVDNCPLIVAFIPSAAANNLNSIFNQLQNNFRIRSGNKYRSLISFDGNGYTLLQQASTNVPLNTILLSNSSISRKEAEQITDITGNEAFNRLKIFIDAPSKGEFAEGNGVLHMLLRDKDHAHEYRVREGDGSFEWKCSGLIESLEYIIVNFHR